MTKKHVLTAFLIGVVGVLGLVGTSVGIYFGFRAAAQPKPREPLSVRLDASGPYLILTTEAADRDFADAIQALRELHPDATYTNFSTESMETVLEQLRTIQPKYALIVLKPGELDVNFAWTWLGITTRIDDDPLVDVSSGFVTGATPEATSQFVERIAKAASGELQVLGKLVDNLGPNPQASQRSFFQQRGCFMIPVFGERTALASISHGPHAFSDERLDSMQDAGLVHFGGHGYPDRIVDGLSGRQAKELRLPTSVVFNGACYTGVTHRWFEQWTANGTLSEQAVASDDSFCLNLLQNDVIAYLAALHPDHGIPVYQEMEYMAYTGASLGDVMRHTHNGVILGNGGQLPTLERFADGMPSPQWTPSDIMLKGTAARVLFGDPALIVTDAFTKPPFETSTAAVHSDQLRITAKLVNTELKSEFTDTYYSDLSSDKQLFNDRGLIRVELPEQWEDVRSVQVTSVQAGAENLTHRLVGYAVEVDHDIRRLHVQVDVPTTGYMQSRLRRAVATVILEVSR